MSARARQAPGVEAQDGAEAARAPVRPPPATGAARWGSFGAPVEKPADFGATARRLLFRLEARRSGLLAIFVMAVGGIAMSALGPKMLGHATDIVVRGLVPVLHGRPMDIDFGALHRALLEVACLYLGASLISFTQSYLLTGIVQRTMYRLRAEVEDKLARLPLSYIDTHARGDLLSRVTNDIDNLGQSLQQTLSQLVTSVLTVAATLVMMFTISWLLALVALITVPLSIYAMRTIMGHSKPRFINQWLHTGRLNGLVEETFTGHAVVKAFGRQPEVEERFRQVNEEMYRASFGAQFTSSVIQPVMLLAGNLNFVVIAVVGGLRVAAGAITIGDVQAFIQYSRQFSQPLTQVAAMVNMFQSGLASAERVFELLDAEEQSPDSPAGQLERPVRGRVEFEHISFSYDPDRPLITDLSLVAEPGSTVAIVGPTGAGKTTLVNLIMRFYELDSGRITLDGRDITQMSRAELRSSIGMVLQDTWLFSGSIRDNLAFGNPAATDDQVVAAGHATYVDRFVHSLPQGYETPVDDEEGTVSVGEKQILTIARAFLADPAILILDEATSSVDTRTEVLIQHAMATLRRGRTSFVIAHRLSTIRDADVILVMKDGQIVETGNHEDLLAADGAYAELYNSQFVAPAAEVG